MKTNRQISIIIKAIVTAFILTPTSVLAQDFDGNFSDDSLNQITNVSQLRDVSPTDWAFEALRSLVERYGCIVGYPDSTFRGNRALSRYEFAAGLNACVQQMEKLIASSESFMKEDLEKLKRLTKEFETELAGLGARVDNLESRVAFLGDNQFSTTTKLTGEVIFAVAGADDAQVTFSDRIRLNFDTSFNGSDLLRIRLQASNIPNLSTVTGTDMTRLSFDGGSDNDIVLNELYYKSPFDQKKGTIWIGTQGLDLDDILAVNRFSSSGTGTLSRFNRLNPLTYRGNEGAGIGVKYQLADNTSIIGFYLADPNKASNANQGIFNSNFSTGLQLNYRPAESLDLSLNYLHSYFDKGSVNLTSSTGSPIGKDPFQGEAAATQNGFSLNADWRITKTLELGGWVGYAEANAQGINSTAELWTWNTHLSISDLGKEGATLSFAGGLPPRAGYVKGFSSDKNTSYILEAQYKYPLTDNIIITPGFYVILNPNHNSDNNTVFVGALRTTLKF